MGDHKVRLTRSTRHRRRPATWPCPREQPRCRTHIPTGVCLRPRAAQSQPGAQSSPCRLFRAHLVGPMRGSRRSRKQAAVGRLVIWLAPSDCRCALILRRAAASLANGETLPWSYASWAGTWSSSRLSLPFGWPVSRCETTLEQRSYGVRAFDVLFFCPYVDSLHQGARNTQADELIGPNFYRASQFLLRFNICA
jgi:hypothetical protein